MLRSSGSSVRGVTPSDWLWWQVGDCRVGSLEPIYGVRILMLVCTVPRVKHTCTGSRSRAAGGRLVPYDGQLLAYRLSAPCSFPGANYDTRRRQLSLSSLRCRHRRRTDA